MNILLTDHVIILRALSNKTKNLQDLQCCNEISSNWLCYQVYQLLYNSYVVYQCAIRCRTMRGHFVTLKLEYFYRQVFIGLFCRKATIVFNGNIRQWSIYASGASYLDKLDTFDWRNKNKQFCSRLEYDKKKTLES